jgi:DNA-binding IclR family transcriptional regulator
MARPALAATRSVSILDVLAAHPADAFTLSDLSDRLGINVASTHALLAVLTDAGYLARHPRHRTYTLGPSLVAVGTAALERHAAIDLARDAARDLSDELELEVAVTSVAGEDIVFLARAGEHRARGIPIHVGQRVPLVPPLGSVFVAWSDDAAGYDDAILAAVRERGYAIALEDDARRGLGDALHHLADAPRERVAIDALLAELARHEYQVGDLDDARTYDVSMVTAPVFGSEGEVALALTLVGFEPALAAAHIAAYGERLRDVGLVITKRTHGRLP